MSYLKLAPSNSLNCKIWQTKTKMPKLGPKMPYWGIFGLQFENNSHN